MNSKTIQLLKRFDLTPSALRGQLSTEFAELLTLGWIEEKNGIWQETSVGEEVMSTYLGYYLYFSQLPQTQSDLEVLGYHEHYCKLPDGFLIRSCMPVEQLRDLYHKECVVRGLLDDKG